MYAPTFHVEYDFLSVSPPAPLSLDWVCWFGSCAVFPSSHFYSKTSDWRAGERQRQPERPTVPNHTLMLNIYALPLIVMTAKIMMPTIEFVYFILVSWAFFCSHPPSVSFFSPIVLDVYSNEHSNMWAFAGVGWRTHYSWHRRKIACTQKRKKRKKELGEDRKKNKMNEWMNEMDRNVVLRGAHHITDDADELMTLT